MAGKRLLHYFKLFPYFVSRSLQARMAYKIDFLIGAGASVLMQFLGFVFLWTIFQGIPQINGWSFYQMTFVYGMAAITLGMNEFMFAGTWAIPRQVHEGTLDRLLLRPVGTLFSIMSADVTLHGLGSVFFGLAVCIASVVRLQVTLNAITIIYWIITIICGALVQFSLNMIVACLAFWVVDTQSAMVMVQNVSDFVKYPISIYGRGLQFLLTFIFPYAFSSYYPAFVILGINRSPIYWIAPILATAISLFIMSMFWKFALTKYQSAGG